MPRNPRTVHPKHQNGLVGSRCKRHCRSAPCLSRVCIVRRRTLEGPAKTFPSHTLGIVLGPWRLETIQGCRAGNSRKTFLVGKTPTGKNGIVSRPRRSEHGTAQERKRNSPGQKCPPCTWRNWCCRLLWSVSLPRTPNRRSWPRLSRSNRGGWRFDRGRVGRRCFN